MLTQPDIFGAAQANPRFAELSVALYEREVRQLANNTQLPQTQLQRKLSSLPFYINRAALALLASSEQSDITIELDYQNASWTGRQSANPPSDKTPEVLQKWLCKYASLALPVPVLCTDTIGITQVRLDTIDQIRETEQRVHLNRWGWFSFSGLPEDEPAAKLLKPNRSSMIAACAGHRWDARGRVHPEPLSLRELLLTATVEWPHFRRAFLLNRIWS